ncbi:ABC transporter ATP-binding protein [Pseudoflavonifractor capillosus]|uniref:ABC transporter ATP-binding protein n=1 Tax=Pseudoflavonifractor capillosus TaxID=106588 RepID=UPI001958E4F4|nr:ABC transporter ATP-binding protein [Pseudoflavonifractor capillosus]MBM6695238.1 ABC transporter ATP-binding protein [Pseudoflavonifractor capillosus]
MIEAKAVSKSFDGFLALNDLDMTVPKGSIYGLVGPNGAGKSTILRHLCGVYRPDSGVITIEGQPVYEHPAIKERMVVIPDDVYYYGSASVREMMKFYRGMYPTFSMERFEKLAEAFPEVDAKRPIRRMSKGMQKQAAFWLAMSCCPDYLLLDEPVDGLDPVMRRQVWSLLMGDVAERGTTVLVSSHNLRELEDVCDHVGILSHGQVVIERSLSQLQGTTVKLQVAFPDGVQPGLPQGMEVLHQSQLGRVYTYIVRGRAEEVQQQVEAVHPLFVEALPLSLEEIFIYEMGGNDYAVRDIVL